MIHDEIIVMPRPSRTIIPPDTVTEEAQESDLEEEGEEEEVQEDDNQEEEEDIYREQLRPDTEGPAPAALPQRLKPATSAPVKHKPQRERKPPERYGYMT